MPLLNPPGEGGVVNSNAFNFTRVTAALSLLIGGATVVGGVVATDASTGGADATTDWLQFNSGQRLVIIVAAMAAWSIVTAADILGRSVATGKALEAGVIPLGVPQLAIRKMNNVADVNGRVYAIRGGNAPAYLFSPDGNLPSAWVPTDDIRFQPNP